MRIVSLFALLLFPLLPSATVGRKTTTATVIEPRTIVSVTEFVLPAIHYQSVLRTGLCAHLFRRHPPKRIGPLWPGNRENIWTIPKYAMRLGGACRIGVVFGMSIRELGLELRKSREFKSKVGKMENITGGLWGAFGEGRELSNAALFKPCLRGAVILGKMHTDSRKSSLLAFVVVQV